MVFTPKNEYLKVYYMKCSPSIMYSVLFMMSNIIILWQVWCECLSLSYRVSLGIIVLTNGLRERIKTRMIYVQQSLVVQHQAFFMA
ncbi:hypothetical protein MY9_3226 [Bacillus sp. JS]|nr:hypothetical protein MY9_3226 [Bacillus sp. JS]